MDFHRGSAGKLSENKPRNNGRLNHDYVTYKEAEIRSLTRGLAEATKMKKKIALLKDDAQTMRTRLIRSSNLAMLDYGTYLESSSYKVIKEPESTRDLYLLHQVNEAKKAESGVAIYDKKDNLLLRTNQGQLPDDCMTLMGRITIHPLDKAKSAAIEKETCVICFDEDIDSDDLMFSVDSRCGHRFCVNCVTQHLVCRYFLGHRLRFIVRISSALLK